MIFLVGFNGSSESKNALSLARDHAAIFGARIVVVASTTGGTHEKPEDIEQATENLVFAENFLKEKEIGYECHQLARGVTPGEDLVRYAEDNNVDLIFVGIERKSRTQKMIIRSNAQHIILKAPCPVVTVNR